MDYLIIAGFILFLALSVLIFKLAKKVMQAIMILFSIAFVIALAVSAVVFFDAQDFKNNFGDSSKVFLLKSDDELITGIYVTEETEFLSAQTVTNYSVYFKAGDYDYMLGDSYKLVIIDTAVMEDLGELVIDNQTFPKETVSDVFASDDEVAKPIFFSAIANKVFTSPLLFFDQYKAGNIIIYPETIMFRVIKLVPTTLIRTVGEKAFEKINFEK